MRRWILLILVLLINSVSALLLTVEEGELVKLKVDAYDPDGNPLTYTYSEPLDENGEWQTEVGDAGEYPIIVTVSDGQSVTEQEITLVVEKVIEEIEKEIEEFEEIIEEKETPPKSIPPTEEEEIIEEVGGWEEEIFEEEVNNPPKLDKINDITVTEEDFVKITPEAHDKDGDEISYSFAYPLDENGEWQTKKKDAGEYVITVTATDGTSADSRTFKIIVNEKRRKKINFEEIDDATLNENEEINIELKADNAEFLAENMPEGATLSENTFHFKPNQDYVGRNIFNKILNKIYPYTPEKSKTITFIAKNEDGEGKQKVKITVKDVNRLPKLEINDIKVNEGEKIIFNPVISDEDGDWLKITYTGEIENNYRTNLDDFGNYKVKAILSDSFHSVSEEFNVVVENVNRKPILTPIDLKKINEKEKLEIKLNGYDPDDDKLTYYIAEGPGSVDEDVFSWIPDYDFVKKSNEQDIVSKIKYFNKKNKKNNKGIKIKLGISDGNLTNEKSFEVIVYDINRKPELINFEPEDSIIIARGGRVVFSVDVNDPDKDKLIYTWDFGFMDSLEGESTIARTFTRKGIKKIKVTIDDSVDSVEKIWKVKVI